MAEPPDKYQSTDLVASASRRFVLALALLPIVPAVAIVGTTAILDFVPALVGSDPARGGAVHLDEIGWFQLIFAILWVAGTVATWRTLVIWTLGRQSLTALVALIPFIQVVYAKPLWTIDQGCNFLDFSKSVQRIGQFDISVGLYVWALVWLWWGVEKWMMKEQAEKVLIVAGPIARRAAASLGIIPVVSGVFMLVGQWLQDFVKISDPTLAMGISALFAVGAWILIWRHVVAWTPSAIQLTAVLAVVCIGVPLGLLWLMAKWAISDFSSVFWHSLPVIGWGVFMALTIAMWPLREFITHGGAPRCLKCGYSLHGLTSTRCPECGDEPTLDRLWGNVESS